ncbi:MAG: glycosyltransferase [Candidatus Babeliales bacterium]|nr:glycosyltransferase [Candidatus Babeliales bacterium]
MKPKIIHLTTSLKVGGAESLICDILRHLKNDYEHHVIYFHDGPNVARIKELGIKTYQIKGLVCKYDPIFCISLFKLIYKLSPNYILSHLWSANLLGSIIAKIIRVPIVCVMHLASNVETQSKNNFLRDSLDKITFACSKRLVAVSDGVYKDLLSLSPAIKEKLTVINNGIDYNNVVALGTRQAKQREDFGLNSQHFVIGCVGRFIPRKRHELLIISFADCVKDNPNIRLFLLGSGPLEISLKNKAKELGIEDKVIFASTDNAYGFYPLFDIYVSTSKEEGLSIALLEAMSFALPCIVTNKTKEHEVITNNFDGFVIEEDQENKLQKVFIKLQNLELRTKMGESAKETVKTRFCFNKMINQYKQVLE